jgi:hypothetical protein
VRGQTNTTKKLQNELTDLTIILLTSETRKIKHTNQLDNTADVLPSLRKKNAPHTKTWKANSDCGLTARVSCGGWEGELAVETEKLKDMKST